MTLVTPSLLCPFEVGVISFTVQIREVWRKKAMQFAQGHTVSRREQVGVQMGQNPTSGLSLQVACIQAA